VRGGEVLEQDEAVSVVPLRRSAEVRARGGWSGLVANGSRGSDSGCHSIPGF